MAETSNPNWGSQEYIPTPFQMTPQQIHAYNLIQARTGNHPPFPESDIRPPYNGPISTNAAGDIQHTSQEE